MQKNRIQKALVGLAMVLAHSGMHAQNSSFNLDVLTLWHPNTGPYIDLLCYVEGLPGNQTEIAAWLEQSNGTVVAADKISLSIPKDASTPEGAAVPRTYQSLLRLAADTGTYQLLVVVGPDPERWDTLRGRVRLTAGTEPRLAPVILAERIAAASDPNSAFSRYGMDVQPLAHWGDHLFTSSDDQLRFYTEAYRIPAGKKAVLQYGLRSEERGELRRDLGGQLKIAAGQNLSALQGGLDLSSVPSGRYTLELTLAVQDMDAAAYPTQKISFFRWNPGEANEYARLTVDPRWVELLGEGEALRRAVSALYPIASQTERLSIESLAQAEAADSLRWRFSQQFWTKRYPGEALVQATAYAERVAEVNKKFSSKAIPGYATDRGRVYLQYGPPTLAERRPYENDAYPYEMWQYNTLDVPNAPYQVNKMFIFGNFDLAGGNYELIHSSAIGELQNPRWRITLQKRSYITGDLDQTGANDGEKFGSRLYNNMFFQSGGNQ